MNNASIFVHSGTVGLIGVVIALIGAISFPDTGADKAGALITVAACWTMLFTRKADEYTQALWTSAASFAFAVLLLLFLTVPFVEGFIDGVSAAFEDRDPDTYSQDISSEVVIGIAIMAFYAGLFWKRLRGGY